MLAAHSRLAEVVGALVAIIAVHLGPADTRAAPTGVIRRALVTVVARGGVVDVRACARSARVVGAAVAVVAGRRIDGGDQHRALIAAPAGLVDRNADAAQEIAVRHMNPTGGMVQSRAARGIDIRDILITHRIPAGQLEGEGVVSGSAIRGSRDRGGPTGAERWVVQGDGGQSHPSTTTLRVDLVAADPDRQNIGGQRPHGVLDRDPNGNHRLGEWCGVAAHVQLELLPQGGEITELARAVREAVRPNVDLLV